MSTSRLYRVCLGSGLRIRGSGAFGKDEPVLSWSQPAGRWQAMLLHHAATLAVNGEPAEAVPWTLVVTPPVARCELRWRGEPPYVYDYFGFVPDDEMECAVALPQRTELGPAGPFWNLEFRKGLAYLPATGQHVAAVARAMLWSVASPPEGLRRNVYVAAVERMIDAETGPRSRVAELARRVGLSQAQLGRLFVAEHGTTPLQFIRTAQARRAHALLTGTVEPIKNVAAECGFPDLHAFNRFVRARLGASPREIRAGLGPVDVFLVEEFRARG